MHSPEAVSAAIKLPTLQCVSVGMLAQQGALAGTVVATASPLFALGAPYIFIMKNPPYKWEYAFCMKYVTPSALTLQFAKHN